VTEKEKQLRSEKKYINQKQKFKEEKIAFCCAQSEVMISVKQDTKGHKHKPSTRLHQHWPQLLEELRSQTLGKDVR
jgi:hypothetical protein